MDELVKQSIKIVECNKKDDVPWKFDEPYMQPFHRWDNHAWQPIDLANNPQPQSERPQSLALYSWNIDFMLPFADSRMRAGLRHLESLNDQQPDSLLTVIFLNECLQSDLKVISEDAWVRSRFNITDVDNAQWQSRYYGTTTLVDKRLPIKSCFRIHYSKTRMERDGLFVDIDVGTEKPIRLCNTHLESLALEPPYRPLQLELCSRYLHDSCVSAGILAGDLNAIQDFDKHLHSDNNLKDAYLELGGREDDAEAGHTWGQQAATTQRERFGTSRMDKVFYHGGVQCVSFERFGMDVLVEDEEERQQIVQLGFDKPWITDHLGIKAVFAVSANQ